MATKALPIIGYADGPGSVLENSINLVSREYFLNKYLMKKIMEKIMQKMNNTRGKSDLLRRIDSK